MATTTKTKADPDAMSVRELNRHIARLRAMLPHREAYVTAYVSTSHYWSKPYTEATAVCSISVYPFGSTSGGKAHLYTTAATWADALKKAEEWIATHLQTTREAAVRGMALAIIEITDQHGECKLSRLSIRDCYVPALVPEAEKRASEMAGNAPFKVVS